MQLPLVLILALLRCAAASRDPAPGTVDVTYIVTERAQLCSVCSAEVRDAVQLEVRGANNQSVHQLMVRQQIVENGQQDLRNGQSEIVSGQQGLREGQDDISATLREIQHHLTSLQPAPAKCPTGWKRHKDSCYFVTSEQTTWIAAHHACAKLDRRARLASVHADSATFVRNLVNTLYRSRSIWLGLMRLKARGNWAWSDGTPVDYTRWDDDQPDNYGGAEDCAHMLRTQSTDKVWNDYSCSKTLHAMCQINLK